jgi:outer membrane protein
MGLEERQPLVLAEPTVSGIAPVPTLEVCETSAVQQRPEMAQVQTARELREHGVSRARADYAPDIAAFGGFRYITDDEGFANPNDSDEWFAGISMTLPIFTGFSRDAKVGEARSNLRQAVWRETEVRRAIRLQVDEAHHSAEAALRRLAAAEQMVEAATRLKTITTAARAQSIGADYRRMLLLADEPEIMEFKVVPDVPEELTAEMLETKAKIDRLAAELELGAAKARLARAMGVRSLEGMGDEAGT